MITPADVTRLSALSRLSLSEEEKAAFASEIDAILGYVSEVQKLSVEGASAHQAVGELQLRRDENPHEPGAFTEAILGQAPAREGAHIKVKSILKQS